MVKAWAARGQVPFWDHCTSCRGREGPPTPPTLACSQPSNTPDCQKIIPRCRRRGHTFLQAAPRGGIEANDASAIPAGQGPGGSRVEQAWHRHRPSAPPSITLDGGPRAEAGGVVLQHQCQLACLAGTRLRRQAHIHICTAGGHVPFAPCPAGGHVPVGRTEDGGDPDGQ